MKLLSLFMCLVLLLTGFAAAEEPAAPVSTVVTVRDAVLTIQGEEYPLNPSLVFGFASDENSALIDFGMPLGDDVLFPVQAKIDENGAAVLLGDSKTAYTFSPEFFASAMEEMYIPEEALAMLTAMGDLIRATVNLEFSVTPEMNLAAEEKMNELCTVTEGAQAQFEANGETQTGTTYAISMDADQWHEMLDYTYAQLPADFTEAYFNYINTMLSFVGVPEVSSFGELMDLIGYEMSMEGEMVTNETSGAGEIVFHVAVDPSAMNESLTETVEVTAEEVIEKEPEVEIDETAIGIIGGADGPTSVMVTGVATTEPVSFDIPMQITVHNPEYVECTVDTELEGIQMSIYTAQQDGAMTASVSYDIPDDGTVVIEAVEAPQEDGSVHSGFSMNADVTGSQFALLCEGESLDGESVHSVGLAIGSEEFSAELYFVVECAEEAFADRIAESEPKVINSIEEAENSVGLMMAAVGLVGDAEPLMNDESIMALTEVVQSFFGLTMTAAEPEEVYIEENPDYYEYTEADENAAAPVVFTEPELTFLPEGYQVVESSLDAEYGMYSATLLHETDEDYENPVYINVYMYETPNQLPEYYVLSGDQASALDGTLVQFYRSDDPDFQMRNAYAYYPTHDVDVYTYGEGLTDDDMLSIISGIVLPE